MYLLNILINMNNKKCMVPKYYIEKLHFVDFCTHIIFPVRFMLSLDNIRTFKLINLQNKLIGLTENACFKDFTVFKNRVIHPCEVEQFFSFSSLWVSISRKILLSKLHKLRSIKSP